MDFDTTTPVVMSLSSHDPSGSSGIQADIETCASLGCHCTPIITTLCAKDTHDTKEIVPIEAPLESLFVQVEVRPWYQLHLDTLVEFEEARNGF